MGLNLLAGFEGRMSEHDEVYGAERMERLIEALRALAGRIRELDGRRELLEAAPELLERMGHLRSELFHYEVRSTYDTPEVAENRRITVHFFVPFVLARTGREAYERARRNPPPSPAVPKTGVVRGAGTGGRALGRVFLHRPGQSPPPDAVLVATSILPTELRAAGATRTLAQGELVLVDADRGIVVPLAPRQA